ncbi:hypothetical protein NPIL_483571 [Nephila pilipes]|uniref:Uncharacterized protein n=1 Tax=Nephila pilipes TaxID=299642 RepID=A0A8X6UT92_NEPPI|nr:hypothetical protein NPIL_483571 [Nephila pilipes]
MASLAKMISGIMKAYDILGNDLEEVADDLIQVLKSETDENDEIEILPWLYRWAYETLHASEVPLEEKFCQLKKMIEDNGDEMKDVMTVLQDIFQGAIHTAALIIGVALYHVARHGSIQQETREELMKYLPEKDSRCLEVPQNGDKIRSLQSIITETFRYSLFL